MTALTAGLAAINAAVPMGADYSRELIVAKCRGLLAGYHARWKNSGYVTLSTEEMVESDLWNPETERKSRTFRIAGKLDVVALEGDRTILFDHKTTSDDIGDPASPYWRQLIVEAQPSHYMLLEWLNGRKMDGAVWDVVKKPGISPKKLAKSDVVALTMTKQYCGRSLSDDVIAQCQHGELRETLEMYEARLAQDCTVVRSEWYFQRRSVPRLDAEILEWAGELWDHGQEILHARNTKRHPRNSAACMAYGRACKYLGICAGFDAADSDKWHRKLQVHSELPLLDGDGRDVLTNSRIKCFQLCRRKHQMEYEMGLERHDEDEAEALIFGTVWHLGLEAWWNFYKGEVHDDSTTGSSVSEIGTAANTEYQPQVHS